MKHKNKVLTVAVAVMVMTSIVSLAVAEFTISDTSMTEDWEGSDSSINQNWNLAGSVEPIRGSRRLEIESEDGFSSSNTPNQTVNDPLVYNDGDVTTLIWNMSWNNPTGGEKSAGVTKVTVQSDRSNVQVWTQPFYGRYLIESSGLLDGSDSAFSGGQFQEDVEQRFKLEIDWDNNNVKLYINGTQEINYNPQGTLDPDLTYVYADFQNGEYPFGNTPGRYDVDDVTLANGDFLSSQLYGKADTYMEPNGTQEYNATLQQTSLDGTVTNTTVKEDVNVTSLNTSILTVDNSTDTITAVGTGTANVTFEYDGNTDTVEILVAPATLANFEHLPSSKWVGAALGINDEQATYGIGSSIQWLFFIVLIGGAAGSISRNPWVAIGSMLFLEILVWQIGFISLGFVLASLFMAIFLGFMMLGVPKSQSSTTRVTVDQSPEFNDGDGD